MRDLWNEMAIQYRHEQLRGVRGIVVDGLPRWDRIAGLAGAIAVTVKMREIGGRNIDAQLMTRPEAVCWGPHVNFEAINAARLEQFRLAIDVPVTGAQNATLQLNCAAIWKNIANSCHEISIDC